MLTLSITLHVNECSNVILAVLSQIIHKQPNIQQPNRRFIQNQQFSHRQGTVKHQPGTPEDKKETEQHVQDDPFFSVG